MELLTQSMFIVPSFCLDTKISVLIGIYFSIAIDIGRDILQSLMYIKMLLNMKSGRPKNINIC